MKILTFIAGSMLLTSTAFAGGVCVDATIQKNSVNSSTTNQNCDKANIQGTIQAGDHNASQVTQTGNGRNSSHTSQVGRGSNFSSTTQRGRVNVETTRQRGR